MIMLVFLRHIGDQTTTNQGAGSKARRVLAEDGTFVTQKHWDNGWEM